MRKNIRDDERIKHEEQNYDVDISDKTFEPYAFKQHKYECSYDLLCTEVGEKHEMI